jgi:AbrB family looped-hinge helix DNA binding protein
MTSKGQITIPIEVRRKLGLTAGTQIDFVQGLNGVVHLRPRVGSIKDLYGVLPAPGVPATIEEMDEAIAQGAFESAGLS